MGESSSLNGIFDSVPFTGIQLATDTTMLPESMRGYAPIIRGIARTNARVIIKQNGYQVYQTYVAPGAFEITDMYPSGGSGDLYVTVEESDGSKQEFVVPFATLPVMVREDQLEYEITSGKYRPYDGGVDETPFTQATATYGVSSSLTLYGGMQAASRYQALSTGLGYNLGELGAASADVTQAPVKKRKRMKRLPDSPGEFVTGKTLSKPAPTSPSPAIATLLAGLIRFPKYWIATLMTAVIPLVRYATVPT